MKRNLGLIMALFVICVVMAGCTPGETPKPIVLRIGVIPITKGLPFYVAEQEEYFQKQGVSVEIVLFSSARERDAALQAGAIDGASTDLLGVALLNNTGVETRAVRIDSHEMDAWMIVSAPSSPIRSPKELAGIEVAVSRNTVIEFVTTQLLRAEGLSDQDIKLVEVSAITTRMEMLSQGQVQAATLPEPMAALAILQGAHPLTDDMKHPVPPTVVAFRQAVLQEHPDAVRAFLKAIELAVTKINADPSSYTQLFFQAANVPESLRGTVQVPRFLSAGVPSAEQVQVVIDWMVERDLISSPIPYERMVDGSFLP